MSIVFQAEDGIEPVSDSFGEQVGNAAIYNVPAGCGVTYDAANMTADLAAGVITHSSLTVFVAVAANAYTFVSDPSNPRWTWTAIDSAGAAVLISGDPAAVPAVPELGDRVANSLNLVQAGQTIAANMVYKLDKRVPSRTQISRTLTNFTKNANDTLGDVTGLKGYIGASEVWAFEVQAQALIGGTPDIKIAFTVPAGAAVTGVGILGQTATLAGCYERSSDFTAALALLGTGAEYLGASGVVVNSTTPGVVQMQAAQNTSTAEDTILYAQSFIKWTRLA